MTEGFLGNARSLSDSGLYLRGIYPPKGYKTRDSKSTLGVAHNFENCNKEVTLESSGSANQGDNYAGYNQR